MIFFLQPTAVLSAEALINIGNKGKSNYLWLNYKFRVVPRISNTQNLLTLEFQRFVNMTWSPEGGGSTCILNGRDSQPFPQPAV